MLRMHDSVLKHICDKREVKAWIEDVRHECFEGLKAAQINANKEIEKRVSHKVELEYLNEQLHLHAKDREFKRLHGDF